MPRLVLALALALAIALTLALALAVILAPRLAPALALALALAVLVVDVLEVAKCAARPAATAMITYKDRSAGYVSRRHTSQRGGGFRRGTSGPAGQRNIEWRGSASRRGQ